MKLVTFITGNTKKAEHIKAILPIELSHQKVDLIEIQSLDIREVVRYKVMEAYKHVQDPVLVEDVSLRFNALGRLPGPFVKSFLEDIDNEGLCKLLAGHTDRSAIAHVCFGLYDGNEIHFFENEQPGTIALEPRGKKGFGWDPIFIPVGASMTYAEMEEIGSEVTIPYSMRRPALKKLEEFLLARKQTSV